MGVNRTMGDLGFILGPLVLGYVADTSGFAPALVVNAGLLATVGVVFYWFAHEETTTWLSGEWCLVSGEW